jgi:hypothetical protein
VLKEYILIDGTVVVAVYTQVLVSTDGGGVRVGVVVEGGGV